MLSHVAGATGAPLWDITIGAALDRAASEWGAADALIDRGQGVRLSWSRLRARADAFALGLMALGLRPGDRIGVWSLNRAEWAITQFAAAKAGLILVTVNPAYRLAELEYTLAEAGCSALVISPPYKSSDYPGMVRELIPELARAAGGSISSARLPLLKYVIQMGGDVQAGAIAFGDVEKLGAVQAADALRTVAAQVNIHDAVNIQFTSGTTGAPKGVTLSHANILNNGYFTGRGIHLGASDRLCIPVPLYHCFGMVMGNLACLTSGATMVYPGEGFDPLATLQAVEEERCTALFGVPTMFIAELEHPRLPEFDLSSLRTGVMAGASCPIEVMRKVADRLHIGEITICYGMTETSPVSFQSSVDDPLERRVTTVGRIHPHVEVKIVDPDGNIVRRGERGELCTRGYSVMLGYWNRPDFTAAAIDGEGWMHSGDLATIDGDGFCNIVGRLKEMVIRGGENLYPREIEEFLYRHPDVRDVQVFGVPDEKYGEELCAWVIPHAGRRLDVESISAFCRGKLSHQKIPRYLKTVAEFPTTVTGKPQKFIMRAAMIEELGLKEAASA